MPNTLAFALKENTITPLDALASQVGNLQKQLQTNSDLTDQLNQTITELETEAQKQTVLLQKIIVANSSLLSQDKALTDLEQKLLSLLIDKLNK